MSNPRADAARRLFPANQLFVAGLLAMPPFLFNPSLQYRIFQLGLFVIFAWATGKHLPIALTSLTMASIVLFNLLVPHGLELARLGSFRITAGALHSGLERAVTLEGLIILSKSTVRPDLRLPGRLGALLGESFRYLECITARQGGIEKKDPIGGIDRLMNELWASQAELPTEEGARHGSQPARWSFALLALLPLLAWLLLLIPVLAKS